MADFNQVQHDENGAIEESRCARGQTRPIVRGEPSDATKRAGESQLLGLSFSGGGIRSATFNLGVLQALADLNLLKRFDYLSTVSGGGYIGSWLTAWIHRRSQPDEIDKYVGSWTWNSVGKRGFATVADGLRTSGGTLDTRRIKSTETPEIGWLRRYSNYLTPKLGLFSGDTWAFFGAYLRNTSLNLTILVLTLAALLILPRIVGLFTRGLPWLDGAFLPYGWLLAGGLLALAACVTMLNLTGNPGDQFYSRRAFIHLAGLLPVLIASWILWQWVWSQQPEAWTAGAAFGYAGSAFGLIWLLAVSVAWWRRGFHASDLWLLFAAFLAGGVAGWLLRGLLLLTLHLTEPYRQLPYADLEWQFEFWGAPVVMSVFLIVETIHIGLAGNAFGEEAREWWGRFGGLLCLYSAGLTLIFALALLGPWLLIYLEVSGYLAQWGKWLLASLWTAVTAGGLWAGRSPATGKDDSAPSLELLGKVAPATFILGLLLILSLGLHATLPPLLETVHEVTCLPLTEAIHSVLGQKGSQLETLRQAAQNNPSRDVSVVLFGTLDGCLVVVFLSALAIALGLSCRVGINEFSMHALYRNRLVRCYLGASRGKENGRAARIPQRFTGFDPSDDFVFSLVGAGHPGPYHLVNTAVNLVSGSNLAWQQRKAASFVVAPCRSGYRTENEDGGCVPAFQPTATCGQNGLANPLTLGMALATSGAAASPNMGYHSSAQLAFLMTLFNVRLGWWLQNPRWAETWQDRGLLLGLPYLFFELAGATNEDRDLVYLSDGGHFENLGIYELVRRRCRYIVACDAGADPNHTFEDLGNAIEKCRADFGINIDIDVDQIRKNPDTGKGEWHCAVGKIDYDTVDENAAPGTLLYIKATLTGDEPTDVARYASLHPGFPHEPTADQWFDESQFESYRMLGHHTTREVFEAVGDEESLAQDPISKIFVELRQRWYPRSHASDSFTKHTATYRAMLNQLKEDPNLSFMDEQLFPEWPALMTDLWREEHPEAGARWLPEGEQERRAGFYFCTEMIQLLEDAYTDLYLEDEYGHPDNRGWMNLMQHCAFSGMFSATYAISASLYGARFQKFCERRLDLHPGRAVVPRLPGWSRREGSDSQNLFDLPSEMAPRFDGPMQNFLQQAEQSRMLNYWEVNLINVFILSHPDLGLQDPPRQLRVVPIRIEQASADERSRFSFTIGFALLSVTSPAIAEGARPWIEYFRIQNHLRKTGLARDVLQILVNTYEVDLPEHSATWNHQAVTMRVQAESNLPQGSALWEAVPDEEQIAHFRRLFMSVLASRA